PASFLFGRSISPSGPMSSKRPSRRRLNFGGGTSTSRLHVLHHILAVFGDGEGTYFGNMLATRRAPTFVFNCEQPNLAIGLNDGAPDPLAASAVARVGYTSKSENTCGCVISPVDQHPTSPIWARPPTGRQICADAVANRPTRTATHANPRLSKRIAISWSEAVSLLA